MRSFLLLLVSVPLLVSAGPAEDQPNPIYRVTVIQRSLPAVNYGHRSAPTQVDFRGTLLAPNTKGEATIESKAGAVVIHAKLSRLGSPAQFGPQYLTYVLWAISPEGQTERLGEVITNAHDEGKLEVSSSLQTFGLLVTAEPYFAVSKPGPVVVMENVVRPDTVGSPEPVFAKYELLPRPTEYTVTLTPDRAVPNGPLVSQREYEVLLSINQARNAVQIARVEGVAAFAPDVLQKAQSLLVQAEQPPQRKSNSERIIMLARQATQTAEDARSIASQKKAAAERPVSDARVP